MSFKQTILDIAGEGQRLSVADKALVNGVVDGFVTDYKKAMGGGRT